MKNMKQQFKDSLREMKNVRSLAAIAMLLAIAVVLGFYQLQLTDFLRLGFSFIANEMTGMLFGPAAGALMSTVADILKYVVKPVGAFFPGLTFSSLLGGLVFGFVLYKRPLTFKRVLLANGIVTVFIHIGLNTYWMTVLYGNSFFAILPARIIKEAIMCPISALTFYIVAKVLMKGQAFAELRSTTK